ncbi:hypothetical protein H8356DRAFT_1750481 [Neocallimastix lanati (nom. inval.)]|jgi:hypothetical protein|nr:hypothetical protein H8356DRAFT_1750481 [Neocallimastix sp. JGI-2020a]
MYNLLLLAISLICFKNTLSYKISTDGKCGPKNGYTICPDNECCNKDGKCGFDRNYCGIECQSEYGFCLPTNYEFMTCLSCIGCIDCDEDPKFAILCPNTCIKKSSYISTDGKCGPFKICPDDQCCDKDGNCGTSEEHCNISLGCQYSFGKCDKNKYVSNTKTNKSTTSAKRTETPNSNKVVVSTDNKCGPDNDKKVCPSGSCCSKYGHCGTSEKYCNVEYGCQIGFGKCYKVITTKKTATAKYTSTKKVSTSTTVTAKAKSSSSANTGEKCGPENGNKVCPSNQCCSKYGNCGTSEKYCDTSFGCLKNYGRCY